MCMTEIWEISIDHIKQSHTMGIFSSNLHGQTVHRLFLMIVNEAHSFEHINL